MMARSFTIDDVRRVEKETGLPFDEIVSLLEKARGNVQEAIRLHRKSRSIFVEPEKVADAPNPVHEKLKRIWHAITGLRLNIFRDDRLMAAIPLIIVMLALLAAPPVAGGALLLMLFLRFRFHVDGSAESMSTGCVVL